MKKVKWANSIKSIVTFNLFEKRALEIQIIYDKVINKEEAKIEQIKQSKVKNRRTFIFSETSERSHFIFLIRQSYYKLTGKSLNMDFCNTIDKKDKKK